MENEYEDAVREYNSLADTDENKSRKAELAGIISELSAAIEELESEISLLSETLEQTSLCIDEIIALIGEIDGDYEEKFNEILEVYQQYLTYIDNCVSEFNDNVRLSTINGADAVSKYSISFLTEIGRLSSVMNELVIKTALR